MNKPMSGMRVLIVTPSFPIPETGAEQSDRANGIRQLVRLGCEVSVIAKVVPWADTAFIQDQAKQLGIHVTTVPYRFLGKQITFMGRVKKHLGKLRNFLYLDGAAYEYADPAIRAVLEEEMETFKPHAVWFEYTYLWPLYGLVHAKGIPVITRSINFEPEHFLEEDGRTFLNYLKYIPKLLGEKKTVRESDIMLAITPKEQHIYESSGSKQTMTLPLRGLPRFPELPRPQMRDRRPLNVFFMGSAYSVAHNRAALAYIVTKIAPETLRRRPGAFVFHVLGRKVPADLERYFDGVQVVYDGPKYGDELESFLAEMDIALIPSLMGAGQQQKVFEPLTRGIPTITSSRAIAEYPFVAGSDYLDAWTPEEFVHALLSLEDLGRRAALSRRASETAARVFSKETLDRTVQEALHTARALFDKRSKTA